MSDTIPQDAPHGNTAPKTTFIYVLIDPETQRVRYVGKSNEPQKRLRAHIRDQSNTYKGHWLTSLRNRGLKPLMHIIEETPFEGWEEREQYWIRYHIEHGHPLTNTFFSCEGVGVIPPETRAKISVKAKNRRASPETRAKMSAARKGVKRAPMSEQGRRNVANNFKGRNHTAEIKSRIAAAHKGNTYAKGRRHSPETRAKMSASHKGRSPSLEAIAKTAAARRGMRHTDEAKAKMSAARKGKPGHPSTPEINAKISAAHKGRKRGPLPEEVKQKLSDVGRGRKQSPEHIAKRAASRRGKKHSPETRAKLSIAQKRRFAKPMSDSPTLWD